MTRRRNREPVKMKISRGRLHRAVRASRRSPATHRPVFSRRPIRSIHFLRRVLRRGGACSARRSRRCAQLSVRRDRSTWLRCGRSLVLEIQNDCIARLHPQRRRLFPVQCDVAISHLSFGIDKTAKRQIHLQNSVHTAQIPRLRHFRPNRSPKTSLAAWVGAGGGVGCRCRSICHGRRRRDNPVGIAARSDGVLGVGRLSIRARIAKRKPQAHRHGKLKNRSSNDFSNSRLKVLASIQTNLRPPCGPIQNPPSLLHLE